MEKAIVHRVVISTSRQNKGNRILKIKCPFCGKEHTHGGGVEGEDVRLYGGSRVSHCWKGAGIEALPVYWTQISS